MSAPLEGQAWTPEAARPVAELAAENRSAFITRTYLHLYGAIVAGGIGVAPFIMMISAPYSRR